MLPNFEPCATAMQGLCDGEMTSTAKVSVCAVPYTSFRSLVVWKLCRSCPMFAPCTGLIFGEHRLETSLSAMLSAQETACHTEPWHLYRSLSAKCGVLTRVGCQVPTKAALSLPLLSWTGERKYNKRLVGQDKDSLIK